jgi:hypothetical protein
MLRVFDRRTALGLLGAAIAGGSSLRARAEGSAAEEPWESGGLAGTFAKPANGPTRGPVAVILAGSGPTPRDGTWNTYRQIAEGLAEAGIRSLRYDKRGVGASRAMLLREEDVVIETFANDGVLAAREAGRRPDVSHTFIIGHSEGALLAILAAAQMPLAGIILLAGPGRRLDVTLREQLTKIPAPDDWKAEAFRILDELVAGRRVANVPQSHLVLFRPSVQPFLLSIFAIDPAERFAKLQTPALVIQAERDLQIAVDDFDALIKARPDAKSWLALESNHVFKRAPANLADHEAQVASYDAAAPLVPGLVEAIGEFIRSIAR